MYERIVHSIANYESTIGVYSWKAIQTRVALPSLFFVPRELRNFVSDARGADRSLHKCLHKNVLGLNAAVSKPAKRKPLSAKIQLRCEKRRSAVEAVQAGESISVVARVFKISHRTLFSWLARYRWQLPDNSYNLEGSRIDLAGLISPQ